MTVTRGCSRRSRPLPAPRRGAAAATTRTTAVKRLCEPRGSGSGRRVVLVCIGFVGLCSVELAFEFDLPVRILLLEHLRDRRLRLDVLDLRLRRLRLQPPRPRRPRAPRAPPRAEARRPRARRASSPRRPRPSKSSIGNGVAADALERVDAILRRSTRTFRARQISSAMSDGVTEPKSEPVGPAFTSNRSTVLPRSSAISCACSAVRASCFARASSTLRSSATRAGVAFSASRRGRR